MRILLVCHSFNSLSQRLFVDLRQAGHEVSVELDIHDDLTREAVTLFAPDLIIAPFLKRALPEDVWRKTLCLIVHPGIRGDRGPSALDRAIQRGEPEWGVTLIEAREEMDAGPVWAWRTFAMRPARKSSLYRHEVTEAAVACVMEAIARLASGDAQPLMPANWGKGREWPVLSAAERLIDPAQLTAEQALTIIRASDGDPGVAMTIAGKPYKVFDAELAPDLQGSPGELLGRSRQSVAIACREGALWIGHLREKGPRTLKLPAVHLLGQPAQDLPPVERPDAFRYHEDGDVGFLEFGFYNGAMSTEDCAAMQAAVQAAKRRKRAVLVLQSGADCWSNGIHLGLIETADSPADESWRNINAMNDLVREIITCDDRIVIAGVLGNAGAGGVFLSLAADEVWMRDGVILNPHYKDMGNLYGSEYWTYLLPARLGEARARRVTQARLPMGVREAMELGLASRVLAADADAARTELRSAAMILAAQPDIGERIADKRMKRQRDEVQKPLVVYREEELQRMRRNFYGFDPSYHVARYNFIRKVPKSRTPATLAIHRAIGWPDRQPGGRMP
ncbi:MAG: hydrogenase maturation protein [Alphaproteobacteria bacterium]|nr:hydrogenase maturation protein [Rhizobiaceae bacterium]MBU3962807.1 hydrogenase maturation protein [Alphaproteobacteria bacterium]MBU4051553.1 hydrogenase maturation protein [Alphaproteobacteria bacterium]MBU4087163.1 hydrogenase maturation protein [Alphaproteobacteria bacterium]MBU4156309.1 hydrogenase maturation protein [Alphaproteobacteria bacterium]